MSVSCAAESDHRGVFTFAALYRGYLECRRRKRRTANAQRYEQGLLDHLVDTAQALQDRTYAPSRSLCFVAQRPKAREIHAADFRDRVVHHVLVPRLSVLFEPVFIHDLYSNRVGKGTHAAVARLGSFMRSVSDNGQRPAWFLQLDVQNFFNRIDQAILFRMVTRRLKKAVRARVIVASEAWDLAWLARVLLKQDFATETVFRGRPADFQRVPEHKRLTSAPPGTGLPIGNLTSQFFANVYLNELDQFVKHQLKCRYYLRYVDDFILLDPDPAQLRVWEQAIAEFLATRLQLALKPERILKPVTDGADFLGYIVRPHYRLVRRRVIGNLRERLDAFARAWVGPDSLRLPPGPREQLRALLASYLGHFVHAHSWRLRAALFVRYPWLGILFDPDPARVPLAPRWEPPAVTSLGSQVTYFRAAVAPALVLIQIGNRVALFGADLQGAVPVAPWVNSGATCRKNGAWAGKKPAAPGRSPRSRAWDARCAPHGSPMPSSPRRGICQAG